MNLIRQKAEMLAMFGTVIQLNRVSRLYVPSNEVYSIGWQVFDKALDGGLRDGELITISGQTGQGKTLTAQNLAYNFSKNNIPSLFFSYEMNPYYLMENFKKIIRDVSPYDLLVYSPIELYERDLKFVEQEIKEGVKNKAIKVVFIDHLHYLIDLKSSLNSSLLIGGIVRELKQIAIRNNVIIFLIAHTKKIYQDEQLSLSSLRDCLPNNQLVYVNGNRKRVDEIKKGDKVLSRRTIKTLQKDVVLDVWKTGIKKVYKLKTKSGREIECSDGHRFYAMTYKKANKFGQNQGTGIAGWTQLKDLQIGQKIAIPLKYPDTRKEDITIEQSKLLGWIIGDGHINKKYFCEITTATLEEANEVIRLGKIGFNLNCKIKKYDNANVYRVYLSGGRRNGNGINQLKDYLKKIKFNPVGKDKYVPEFIFGQSKRIIGAFLSGLFQADGSIHCMGKENKSLVITLPTISEKLANDILSLLIRVGIMGRKRVFIGKIGGYRTSNKKMYSISFYGSCILKFGKEVGFFGDKQKKYEKVIKNWKLKDKKRTNDIFFERIKSIDYIGKKETYDISVKGHHSSLKNNSFCVQDIITHNSSFISQESDYVFLVERKKKSLKERLENEGQAKGTDWTNQTRITLAKNRRTGKMFFVDFNFQDNKLIQIDKTYGKQQSF